MILLSLSLFWCGNSWQNMSFSDAYEKLIAPEKVEDYIEKTFENKIISEKTTSNINISMTDGFLFSWILQTNSIYDTISWNAEIGFGFTGSADIQEAKSNINTAFSWKLQTNQEKLYLYIDAFDVKSSSSGQIDSLWLAMLSPIMNTISKQRIDFSPENNSGLNVLSGFKISPYSANIKQLFIATQHALKTYPLIKETGKTKIEGKLAYQIGWDAEGVSGFINEILKSAQNIGGNVEISDEEIQNAINDIMKTELSGHIIVYSEDNILLRVDSLRSEDAWTLSMNISTKKGATFTLLSNTNSIVFTGEAWRKDKENHITINLPENNIQITVQIPDDNQNVSAKIIGSWFNAEINSNIQISPLDAYAPSIIKETKTFQTIYNGLMGLFWSNATTWDLETADKGTEAEWTDTIE